MKKNLIPSDYKILLRVHPHLSGIRSDINYQKKVQKLANKYNILYIGSDIPIDSYRLICASELCITFGSTIGAEAALLRTKSLCIGVGLYDKFNCVFIPKSFKEIEEFIKLKVSENYLNDMQSNAIEFFTKLNAFSIPYPKNISTMFMKYLFLKKIVFYFLRRNYRIKEFFYYLFKLNFKALRLGYGLRHNIIHNKNEPFKKPLYD